MAGRSVQDLLQADVILEIISQIELPGTTLQRLMGWPIAAGGDNQPGMSNPNGNTIDHDLRDGSYDVFDVSRRIAPGATPGGTRPTREPRQVGKVRFTIPRSAETIPLKDAEIHRRRLGEAPNIIDRGGEQYIMRQTEDMAQTVANLVEFQTAAMLRGSYTFYQNDDRLEHTFTGGEVTIDYQIPANNKNQLNSIIAASWATTSTDIPGHIQAVNSQSLQDTGAGIRHIIMNGVGWQYIVNNQKIAAQGGTANVVFQSMRRVGEGEFEVVLRAIPWITWHIVDYGLEVWDGSNYTWTKLIADDQAVFLPEPSPKWCQYILGAEWVTEGPNGVKEFRRGFYPFAYPTHDPSGWALCYEFNGFPSLPRPKSIYNADIAF